MRKVPKISSKAANLPYPSSRKSKLQKQSSRPSHQASLRKKRKTRPRHKLKGCLFRHRYFCRVLIFICEERHHRGRTAQRFKIGRQHTATKKRVKKSQTNKAGAAKTGIINFKRRFKIDALLKKRKHKYKDDLQ